MQRPTIETVLLFLTYRCNMRCPFCMSFNGYWQRDACCGFELADVTRKESDIIASHGGEMTADDIRRRVIPECQKNGVQELILAGGEIFVRDDILEVLAALGDLSMEWSFESNMMLCSDVLADAIVRAGCSTALVSLDGTEEVHNTLRANPRAFSASLAGIRRLMSAKNASRAILKVVLNCVLQPGNEMCPVEIVEIGNDLGVDGITFTLLRYRGGSVHFDYTTTAYKMEQAFSLAHRYGIVTCQTPLSNIGPDTYRAWFTDPSSIERRCYTQCDYIRSSVRIDPQGYVIPCLEYAMGNILRHNLADIWLGKRFTSFRSFHMECGPFDACLRCENNRDINIF